MRHYVPAAFAVFLRPLKEKSWWLGLALAGTVAAAAMALAKSNWAQHLGLSALTLAIVCGIVAGNTVFPVVATHVSTVSVRPRHLPCRSDQAHSHAP